MKRILYILLIIAASTVSADEKSTELLGKMSEVIKHSGNYRIEFSSTIEDHTMGGYYMTSGNYYHIHVPDTDIYYTDSVRYEIDYINKEITIDNAQDDSNDIMLNPAHVLSFMDTSLVHSFIKKVAVEDKSCYMILIEKKDGSDKMKLYIDTGSMLPVKVEYFFKNINSNGSIDVTGFSGNLKTTVKIPDLNLYKDFDVIDFRK